MVAAAEDGAAAGAVINPEADIVVVTGVAEEVLPPTKG